MRRRHLRACEAAIQTRADRIRWSAQHQLPESRYSRSCRFQKLAAWYLLLTRQLFKRDALRARAHQTDRQNNNGHSGGNKDKYARNTEPAEEKLDDERVEDCR